MNNKARRMTVSVTFNVARMAKVHQWKAAVGLEFSASASILLELAHFCDGHAPRSHMIPRTSSFRSEDSRTVLGISQNRGLMD